MMEFNFSYWDIVFLIAFVALMLFVVYKIKQKKKKSIFDLKEMREKWNEIIDLLNYKKEMNYKLAVIEADKLLDYALKKMAFPGETMAKRLEAASYKFPELKKVWWAHKVRNLIVHDHKYYIKYNVANKVLKLFKNALKELGAV